MDTATGSSLMEEFELMKQAKYRVYMQNIDKALKSFEYSSEWADLISALARLNKVISGYPQYQVIPRRIKISKRLSQCMHPALPSGVHLKALEAYDVIFSNTGLERLASELFIYSAGLFPLMQHAAMNVRPSLLEIYEKYFVPLGERLRPALSGFLSGVLPGLEAGLDHFDRTNSLLSQVCHAVSPIFYYTCLWECVTSNESIRLPAITYVIDHFNKRVGMSEQRYLIGRNSELMMSGLCACLNDSVILVQRNTLEFLLLGFPLHTTLLSHEDLIKLVTNGLNTILRRDMSLNRRVYSWLLGSEVQNSNRTVFDGEKIESADNPRSYFDQYSKQILIKALKIALKNSVSTSDLRPYKILLSLLDKVEIGPAILDSILIDVIRTTALVSDSSEVKKSVNTLFGNFDPSYIWNFITNQFELACKLNGPKNERQFSSDLSGRFANDIDSGEPNVIELCFLVECLLDILSLEMFNETTRVYLPRVLFAITKILSFHGNELTEDEVTATILLCSKIIKHIQPMILDSSSKIDKTTEEKIDVKQPLESASVTFQEQSEFGIEKSKSDSKLNQSAMDEPMKRSRSNHNMGGKKSPKKSSKKSKSHSKLYELDKEVICADTGQLVVGTSNATSAPNLDGSLDSKKSKKKDKKQKKTNENSPIKSSVTGDSLNESKESTETAHSEPITKGYFCDVDANKETKDEISEAQLQKYTILEKCSKQFEVFFEIFFTSRLLGNKSEMTDSKCSVKIELSEENTDANKLSYFLDDEIIESKDEDNCDKIDQLFDSLRTTKTCRHAKLHSLLNRSIGDGEDIQRDENENNRNSNQNLKALNKLLSLKLDVSTTRAVKHLTQLLVTFSTIPNYDQTLPCEYEEEESLPTWLKVLSIVAAFSKSDKDLQITTISTLFELIDIVKCQKKVPNRDIKHLVMLPLLKQGHIIHLENRTRVFQVFISTLWDYLDTSIDVDLVQITILIYRLHSCLESGLVERTISDRIENSHLLWTSSDVVDSDLENNDDRLSAYKLDRLGDIKIMLNLPQMSATNCSSQLTERQSSGFKKFELLWNLGREQKECFEKILLKIYDNLSLPQHISMRTFVVKWLKESLLRGDLGRLLLPLFKIMLNPNTKRISISNMHLLRVKDDKKLNEQVFDEKIVDDKDATKNIIVENEVYVIKMDNGAVTSHVESKKKSPIGSIQKKIFNITSISDKMRDRGLMPSIPPSSTMETVQCSAESDASIGLIVNPLEPLDQQQQQQQCSKFISKSAPTSIIESKKFSDESSSEYTTTSGDSMSDNEMSEDEKLKLSGRTEILHENKMRKNRKRYDVAQNESDTNDDSITHTPYDESATAADEYFSRTSADEEHNRIVEGTLRDADSNSNNSATNKRITISEGDEDADDEQRQHDKEKISLGSEQKSLPRDTNSDSEKANDEDALKNLKHLNRKRRKLFIKSKNQITRETLEKGKENVKILKKNLNEADGYSHTKSEKLHPFHTHLLIYHSCYDTKQILYCFETLRNLIVAGNPKLFMCLTINTSVSETQLKHLLIRHRKSIFGKGFEGSLTNTEFNNAYRGVMLIEVLITLCLYYARSYFKMNQNDASIDDSDEEENIRPRSQDRVSPEDILANCKIQLAAIEMLNLIFTELISIVKEMGKGLASYIADLMIKCKVQKVILHCMLTSVHYSTTKTCATFSEKILKFNDHGGNEERMHLEAIQIQLLKLLDSVIKLEHETIVQKGDNKESSIPKTSSTLSSILSQSPTRAKPMTDMSNKYIQNLTISQQPMFLTAILNALLSDNLKHLHKNWTELVTSSLNCFSSDALSNIVVSIMHQLCENIDKSNSCTQVSSDYVISQLEALTVICHFCLLDNQQQQVSLSHLFNPQHTSLSAQSSSYGQIYNNILNFFLSSSSLQVGEAYNKHQLQQNATRTCVLSHLPRIISSMAILLETQLGQDRLVKQQLMEFITPIALHHGCNFLAGIAVVWYERSDKKLAKNVYRFQKPANEEQMSLIKMILGIKVIPFDSFVQTLNSVIKSPPQIYRPPPGLVLNVSALEFFYVYIKNIRSENLNDSWTSLLNLLRDSLSLSPPAQFMLFCILYEIVKECSPFDRKDKKDIRDLHDITTRLIDVISSIAGSCLEQTTWLRRNLAVTDELTPTSGNQQFTVEAQSILSHILVHLLDYAFGSQEKDKITQIVTTLMYNIIPYLKNHTAKNVPFFYACSNLLSSLTPYQYTRKAWRKDVFDLFLDPTFFQMDISCLPFWKQILDNLMSYDNVSFRELMGRLSVAQTGSLNIFTSKEQEYEQKAMLLKKLAFVIFCSEKDQYQKYMPEIQEQLSTCLRLPQVIPCVQAAVLLCFRVLLLRISPDHITSLWPTIIAEMVQVFLSIEQELMTDTEEFRTQSSQHIRMLSGLDTAWVTNTSNGLHAQNHPTWRMVQLETAKLLELGCVLPASVLPHFQMYRWAFVGSQHDYCSADIVNGGSKEMSETSKFIPHVTRIAQLMDFRYTTHSPSNNTALKGSHLVLTCQSINTLQDLYGFFSTLCIRWPNSQLLSSSDPENDIKNVVSEIEQVLSLDFLEKMLTSSR